MTITLSLSFDVTVNGKRVPFAASLTPNNPPHFVGTKGELNGLTREETLGANQIAEAINQAYWNARPFVRAQQRDLFSPELKRVG